MEKLINLVEETLYQVPQNDEKLHSNLMQINEESPALSKAIQWVSKQMVQCAEENRLLKELSQQAQIKIKSQAEDLEWYKQMLNESQELTRTGSWEINFTNSDLFLSDEMYRLFGLDPMISNLSWDYFLNNVVHPDDAEKIENHNRQAINIGIFKQIEYRIVRSDGGVRNVLATGNVRKNEEGQPVGIIGCLQDITDKKRSEKELRQFKFCVDQAPDAISWINRDGLFIYVNERSCEMLGYSYDEMLSMSLKDVQPDFEINGWKNRWRTFEKNGSINDIHDERINRHKDGHLFPVEISAKHVWIEGSPLHVGFARDISQRKAVDQKLRITQYSLDEASIGCFWLDEHGRFIYVNKKYCELLGYTQEELNNKYLFDIDPGVEKKLWPKIWARFCDAKNWHFGNFCRKKNEELISVETTATLLEYDGITYSINFVQDITERKEIEAKLRLAQFIFDNASIGIFLFGPDGNIKMANNQACANLGYSREELSQKNVSDIVVSDYLKRNRKKLLETKTLISESRHRRSDGKVFPVEVIFNHIQLEDEENTIAFTRDITEQKQAEKERKKLEDRIVQSQKMEALGTLAGGIAHDFNNILSAIYGFAELAKMSCEHNSTAETYLDNLRTAGDRAKKLVEQILIFSRQDTMEKRPSDIGMIIAEALNMIRASIPSTIEIKQDVPYNLGAVSANQIKIHQAIMNLCTNAYHSMKADGGILGVTLAPVKIEEKEIFLFGDLPKGNYLMLTVSDTGHGMSAETMSHIFDPYFTTKDAGEGSGMGLSTVLGIVNDHNGSIRVSSQLGEGTTFQLYFPLLEEQAEYVESQKFEMARGEETILFVDDEAYLIEIATAILSKLGYKVDARNSAYDALGAFRAQPHKYDLLITDMTMPKMTGGALSREIRKIRPDLPIIICTGFSEQLTNETLRALKIDAVLLKPVSVQQMAVTIRQVLDMA